MAELLNNLYLAEICKLTDKEANRLIAINEANGITVLTTETKAWAVITLNEPYIGAEFAPIESGTYVFEV